jgi:hypothetical protein
MGSNQKTLSQDQVDALFLKQGLQVLEPYVNSRTRIKAKCLGCGTIVEPYYRQIWAGQRGCRNCSSNRLKTSPSEVSETLNQLNLKLVGIYKNSKTPVEIECTKCNFRLTVVISNLRQKKIFYCPGCEPKRSFLRKRKTLTDLELNSVQDIFSNFHYELIGDYESINKPVSVKHVSCGTISNRSLKNIRKGAGFCTGCRRNRSITKEEALRILNDAGFEAIGNFVNGDTPWEAQCINCGKTSSPSVHTLKGKKSGCGYCKGVKVDPVDARNTMLSAGYTPLEPYRNSKSRWKSRHEVCGQIVYPMYNSIQAGQGGCTDCGDKYSFHEPSYFYVMEHSLLNSLKIGISNFEARDNRVLIHSKHGWMLAQRIEFENGFMAYEFEQTLLNHIRNTLGVPVHLSKADMPQSGYSETMSSDFIQLPELLKLVRANQLGELSN